MRLIFLWWVLTYRIVQGLDLPPGDFFSTALTASSKTSANFVCFFAEHSMCENAPIFFCNFLPSWVVTYFSEPTTRRSDFVPFCRERRKNVLTISELENSQKICSNSYQLKRSEHVVKNVWFQDSTLKWRFRTMSCYRSSSKSKSNPSIIEKRISSYEA